MAGSTRDLKRRIQSVKNTQKITKAMELVAASKMRKAQEAALRTRPYTHKALELLSRLRERTDEGLAAKFALFAEREVGKVLLVLVTTDKGLCGGLNSNVIRRALRFMQESQEQGRTVDLVTVGKKGQDAAKRIENEVAAEFIEFGDHATLAKVSPISRLITDAFVDGTYDQVVMCYTNFVSTLKQDPLVRQILPLNRQIVEDITSGVVPETGRYSEGEAKSEPGLPSAEYLLEPSADDILKGLIPKLIEILIYDVILEANASEHSARMVAMKNASDSAGDMIDSLTLEFNKARQAAITQEIAEVSAGKAALEE